jgi:hypothetical protein
MITSKVGCMMKSVRRPSEKPFWFSDGLEG